METQGFKWTAEICNAYLFSYPFISNQGHAAEKDNLATEASRSTQASSVPSGRKPSHQDQPAIPPAPQTSSAASFLIR